MLLRALLVVADELHFGRAAARLGVLPASLGRNIRLLEEALGARLFVRTTRNVTLTKAGRQLAAEARTLLNDADAAFQRVREIGRNEVRLLRIGAIDSAATGLVPELVRDLRAARADVDVNLTEDKSVRLAPKLVSGALDLAFVRPPIVPNPAIELTFLMNEPIVVALPVGHALASREALHVEDLATVPLIVPSPRSRPHSYNLTTRLFARAGMEPNIAQQAEEKQTIVTLVGTGIGAALVPHWTSRLAVSGVVYRRLLRPDGEWIRELPLAAAWAAGSSDSLRDEVLSLLRANLDRYAR